MKKIKIRMLANSCNLSLIINCSKLLQVLQFLSEKFGRRNLLPKLHVAEPLPCSKTVRITKFNKFPDQSTFKLSISNISNTD